MSGRMLKIYKSFVTDNVEKKAHMFQNCMALQEAILSIMDQELENEFFEYSRVLKVTYR